MRRETSALSFICCACFLLIYSGLMLTTRRSPTKSTSETMINSPQTRSIRKNCRGSNLENEITLVTMYLNLGKFQKGKAQNFLTTEGYLSWMKSWALVNNTVVAFFDDQNILERFKQIRSKQPPERTSVYKIDRSELAAFNDLNKTAEIFAQPNYPRHFPNTVNAEYSCSMAAKADVLDRVLTSKQGITTKYIAWLDMGYFRLLTDRKFYPSGKTFRLEAPEGFDDRTVGFSETRESPAPLARSPWQMIRHNVVWAAGGMVLATPEVMGRHVRDVRAARQELLSRRMMSTDQQVLAALYSRQLRAQPSVNASTRACAEGQFGLRSSDRMYFCLGFMCKEAAEIRAKTLRYSCED